MVDIFTKKKRSEVMSKVRSRDSKIEILFRKKLWAKGLRYSKNSSKYFGKPDVVLLRHRAVVFVDSCFWHGCKKHGRIPASNKSFWIKKVERNKIRDKKVSQFYKKQGWKVFRVWEHEIMKNLDKSVEKIIVFLSKV